MCFLFLWRLWWVVSDWPDWRKGAKSSLDNTLCCSQHHHHHHHGDNETELIVWYSICSSIKRRVMTEDWNGKCIHYPSMHIYIWVPLWGRGECNPVFVSHPIPVFVSLTSLYIFYTFSLADWQTGTGGYKHFGNARIPWTPVIASPPQLERNGTLLQNLWNSQNPLFCRLNISGSAATVEYLVRIY